MTSERPTRGLYRLITIARLEKLLLGADGSTRWRLAAEFLEEYRRKPVKQRFQLRQAVADLASGIRMKTSPPAAENLASCASVAAVSDQVILPGNPYGGIGRACSLG